MNIFTKSGMKVLKDLFLIYTHTNTQNYTYTKYSTYSTYIYKKK